MSNLSIHVYFQWKMYRSWNYYFLFWPYLLQCNFMAVDSNKKIGAYILNMFFHFFFPRICFQWILLKKNNHKNRCPILIVPADAVTSVVSDSVWPQRWQPTRLPRPWDSPGKCKLKPQSDTSSYSLGWLWSKTVTKADKDVEKWKPSYTVWCDCKVVQLLWKLVW